jgi:ribosomal protein S18 acetylase RimI-like enzyme
MSSEVTLRPAGAEDTPFLQAVYASTRWDELAQAPWSDEQKLQFCLMQFAAQDADYRQNYPKASFSVIEQAGVGIGRLYVDRRPDEIHLIDIALLPAYRRSGIGTRLLQEFQEEACATRKKLTIYVEQFNPALRLYQRLGFRKTGEHTVYFLMEWVTEASP